MFDPRQLEALQAVHAEGSFQGAARALQLTPAAITQRIKALEAAVGSRVLIRGKTLRLTPPGEAILTYQQRAHLLAEDLLRALNLDGQTYTRCARLAPEAIKDELTRMAGGEEPQDHRPAHLAQADIAEFRLRHGGSLPLRDGAAA